MASFHHDADATQLSSWVELSLVGVVGVYSPLAGRYFYAAALLRVLPVTKIDGNVSCE